MVSGLSRRHCIRFVKLIDGLGLIGDGEGWVQYAGLDGIIRHACIDRPAPRTLWISGVGVSDTCQCLQFPSSAGSSSQKASLVTQYGAWSTKLQHNDAYASPFSFDHLP